MWRLTGTFFVAYRPPGSTDPRLEGSRRRRKFITVLGGAAAWPLAARAQQSQDLVRSGVLPFGSPSNQHDLSYVEAFRKGLFENGLIEGRNVTAIRADELLLEIPKNKGAILR